MLKYVTENNVKNAPMPRILPPTRILPTKRQEFSLQSEVDLQKIKRFLCSFEIEMGKRTSLKKGVHVCFETTMAK